jgi:hypothetical protein
MPFCHYEKLEEDLTKKGKKKYFITIAWPQIHQILPSSASEIKTHNRHDSWVAPFYAEGDKKADSMLYNFEAFTCRGQPESI